MKHFLLYIIFISLFTCSSYEEITPGTTRPKQISTMDQTGKSIKTNLIYSVPNTYNPKEKFPLIVCLHGSGSNSAAFHDLFKPVTDELGYLLLTPQGSKMTDENFGWSWGENAEQSILNSIDYVRQTVNIDISRIYILGFSSGGSLAWKIGLKYPHNFAGIVPLCSTIDSEKLSPTNYHQKFYLAHGELEESLHEPYSQINEMLKQSNVKSNYVVYDGVGHDLPELKGEEIRRIFEFLENK